jgi:hypothetical protein
MKRRPIELACYFKYRRVRPEEKWRLALYRINIGPASINNLVRYDGIHSFTVDWLGMHKRRKANGDGEEDYPKQG